MSNYKKIRLFSTSQDPGGVLKINSRRKRNFGLWSLCLKPSLSKKSIFLINLLKIFFFLNLILNSLNIARNNVFDGNLVLVPLQGPEKLKKNRIFDNLTQNILFFLNLILNTMSIARNDVSDGSLFLLPLQGPEKSKKVEFLIIRLKT